MSFWDFLDEHIDTLALIILFMVSGSVAIVGILSIKAQCG
jgi:hypothetical protein